MTHSISTNRGPADPSPSATDPDILSGGAGCGARLPRQPIAPNDHAAVVPDLAFAAEDPAGPPDRTRWPSRVATPRAGTAYARGDRSLRRRSSAPGSGRAPGSAAQDEPVRWTSSAPCHRGPRTHLVVACILTHAGRVCLLRRSRRVASDPGKWHCVTGFVAAETPPVQQAFTEIYEETGLGPKDLHLARRAVPLRLVGGGCAWIVLPYLFEARHSMLSLNWEHDAYRWAAPGELPGIDTVAWLADVGRALDVAGPGQPTPANTCSRKSGDALSA